jgi:hypothetical protein
MGDYDDDIARQSPKPLAPQERQHVRLVLELQRGRQAFRRIVKTWGTWLFAAVAAAVAMAQFFFGKGH